MDGGRSTRADVHVVIVSKDAVHVFNVTCSMGDDRYQTYRPCHACVLDIMLVETSLPDLVSASVSTT